MSTTSLGELASTTHKATGCIPPKLLGASTTVVGDTVYLLGGTRGRTSSERFFHMYIFDLSTHTWAKIPEPDGPVPSPRYLHSTELWNGYLVVFGGIVIEKHGESPYVLDDIWFFSILESCWILSSDSPTSSRPLPRYGHLSSISADKLFIIGGQDKSDHWLDDMHLYDLKSREWTHSSSISYHCGTYRGLAAFSNLRVIDPSEEGYGTPIRFKSDTPTVIPSTPSDKFVELPCSSPVTEENPSEIYMYLNYDFTNPRRELRQYKATNDHQNPFTFQDLSSNMQAKFVVPSSVPPTLRFPTGGIIGSYLVLSGIDFTTRHKMGTWALNLQTLTWMKIEMSSSLAKGSWARSIVWPSCNKLVIFGSRDADFEDDYQSRLLSWDDVVCVDLEAFGIYRPPFQAMTNTAKTIGLAALEDEAFADFIVVCDDGRSIPCSRELLERRWPWFLEERKKWDDKASETFKTSGGGTPAPSLALSRTSVILRPDPRLTPRKLYISEPYPVVVAFLQYLYTQSLLTPLQLAPAVLSSLMLLAAAYDIPRLMDLVAHAMHHALSRSRKFAPGIYDVVSLVDRSGLRHRALWIGRRPNKADRGHSHLRKPDHHHPNDLQLCPPSSCSVGADPNSGLDHKETTQHKHQTQHPSIRSRSTTPQSVPVSVSQSPAELTPTASFAPGADVNDDTSLMIQNDKIRKSVSVRRTTGGSMFASFVAAIMDFSSEDDSILGLARHGLTENGKSNESETMVMQNDDLTSRKQLHHLNTRMMIHIPTQRLVLVTRIGRAHHVSLLPMCHMDNDLRITELQLLELRSMINQVLGSVALGPLWDSRKSVEVNRRLSKNEIMFNPHRIKATSGHNLLIDPRCTSPSTRGTGSDLMPMTLRSISEVYGENGNEHKGPKEEEGKVLHKIGRGYPASALDSTSAGSNSFPVPVKHRERRSSSVPQPYVARGHSATSYHLSRQLGPLPATPSPSKNLSGIAVSPLSGSNANIGGTVINTNTFRMVNVQTSPLQIAPRSSPTQLTPRTVHPSQTSNYTSTQPRNQTRDNPSSSTSPIVSNGSPSTARCTRHPPLLPLLPLTPPHSGSDESDRSSPPNSSSFHSNSNRKSRLISVDQKASAGLPVSMPVKPPALMTMSSSSTAVTPRLLIPIDPPMNRGMVRPRPLPPRPDVVQSLTPP